MVDVDAEAEKLAEETATYINWIKNRIQSLCIGVREEENKRLSKQLLDMLDEVVRETPELKDFIYPIKRMVREARDGKS